MVSIYRYLYKGAEQIDVTLNANHTTNAANRALPNCGTSMNGPEPSL